MMNHFARERQWRTSKEHKDRQGKGETIITINISRVNTYKCEEMVDELSLSRFVEGRQTLCRARRRRKASNTWASFSTEDIDADSIFEND